MKNKKSTYFLGVSVLVVWGVIIYRIFISAAGNNDQNYTSITRRVIKEPYNDYVFKEDTSHLLLNYKDPFDIQKQVDTLGSTSKKKSAKINLSSPKALFNWDFIKYSGYVRNPKSQKLVAVININGSTMMMLEGETENQVKLLKNLQDSIKITFNGKTKFIKMQSGAL